MEMEREHTIRRCGEVLAYIEMWRLAREEDPEIYDAMRADGTIADADTMLSDVETFLRRVLTHARGGHR